MHQNQRRERTMWTLWGEFFRPCMSSTSPFLRYNKAGTHGSEHPPCALWCGHRLVRLLSSRQTGNFVLFVTKPSLQLKGKELHGHRSVLTGPSQGSASEEVNTVGKSHSIHTLKTMSSTIPKLRFDVSDTALISFCKLRMSPKIYEAYSHKESTCEYSSK